MKTLMLTSLIRSMTTSKTAAKQKARRQVLKARPELEGLEAIKLQSVMVFGGVATYYSEIGRSAPSSNNQMGQFGPITSLGGSGSHNGATTIEWLRSESNASNGQTFENNTQAPNHSGNAYTPRVDRWMRSY